VPAPASFTREFQLDKKNLQREQKGDVSPALSTASYLAVLALTIVLLGVLFWALRRIYAQLGSGGPPPTGGDKPLAREPRPRPA
jgi:hypothetical protein